MMTRLRPATLALACFLATAPNAIAQRESAPVIEGQTTSELVATMSTLRASNADLVLEMSELQAENSRLTGRVEELQFLLRQNGEELKRLQSDDKAIAEQLQSQSDAIAGLEARIEAMALQVHANAGFAGVTPLDIDEVPADEGSGDGPVPLESPSAKDNLIADVAIDTDLPQGTLGTISASDLPGDAGTQFSEAMAKLQAFDYAGAESAFRGFLAAFGDDPQAAEAQYWLAETLYQQQSHAESGAAYTDMIEKYPDDKRAPDALWKLARSMRLIGDGAQACALLDVLPQRYPNLSPVTNNYVNRERALSSCAG